MKMIDKERLYPILDTLAEANIQFSNIKTEDAMVELCSMCQETALAIGNNIEEKEKKPERTINYLEKYCELIYELSLIGNRESEYHAQIEKIEEILGSIRRSIQKDLPDERSEAVFLPYKASMWDSFHSVYQACKKDDRFQVYVVPIPYYYWNKDRSVISQEYEGEEIAAYAEITDYREYNLAQRKPDVVFIHNPYDDRNTITQVPETFFSRELVKYTKHLIYIPYYVSKRLTAPHMPTLPGVQNSWRTFVQSERMRQQYISHGVPEQKVQAFGSPKFDMVREAQETYSELPKEWSGLKGKKIAFYNTHITGLMADPEAFIKKVANIIEYFKQRDDIALLWRPHPLCMETVRTYHPEAEKKYKQLIASFKQDGNGIYDDTANLERSIAIADFYIGEERSSVSTLFKATGKPMYYVECFGDRLFSKKRYARAICAEKVKENIYMYSWEHNHITVYNEQTKEIRFLNGADDLEANEKNAYSCSVRHKEFIYFIPIVGESILKLNTLTEELQYIPLARECSDFNVVVYENIIYLMPIYFDERIPYLELEKDEVGYVKSYFAEQIKGVEERKQMPLFYGAVQFDNCIWRACRVGPYIQKYSLEKQSFTYIQVNGASEGFKTLAFDGTYFWVLTQNGTSLIQWDHRANKIISVAALDRWIENKERSKFVDVFCYKESIWLIPYDGGKIIRRDAASGQMIVIDCKMEHACNQGGSIFARNYITEGRYIYLIPYRGTGIIRIDTETNAYMFMSTEYDADAFIKRGNMTYMCSEELCNLDDFLDQVRHYKRSDKQKAERPAGEQIWDYITANL